MTENSGDKTGSAALPERWIVPIRVIAYIALGGSCAYLYWNARELEATHYMIFLAIAAACAMALLDCRMSVEHWDKKRIQDEKAQKAKQNE